MTVLAGDHSTAGSIIGGSLKAAGLGGGIVRYACAGRGSVNITPGEVRDLKANGIPIGIVCEHEADWLLRPNVAGRVAGSAQIARACGLPDGVTYLACDFDVTLGGPTAPGSPGDRNMQGIAHALGEAATILTRQNVGFYGSKFAIDWLIAHGWADIFYWQTEAWSHGQLSPAAHLFQRAQSVNVHGVSVDVDVVLQPVWGQRTGSPAPKPKPKPPPPAKAKGTFNASLDLAYAHDARDVAVAVHGTAGDVQSWGDVNEDIHLTLDLVLPVGPKRGKGVWRATGKVGGATPR